MAETGNRLGIHRSSADGPSSSTTAHQEAPMAIERIHTYCAMCVSRCGVLATVSDGVSDESDPGSRAPERVHLREGHGGS